MKNALGRGQWFLRRTLSAAFLLASLSVGGLVTGVWAASAGVTKTFDITTYTEPGNVEPLPSSSNHVSFRRVDPDRWILFSIYGSRAKSRDMAAEFAFDWNDLNAASRIAPPPSVARKVGAGSDAREGGVFVPAVGYVDLVDVHAQGRVVAIIIECGSAEQFRSYQRTIDAFLGSLVVSGAHQADSAANITPATAAPAPATGSKQIQLSDLVGLWDFGSSAGTTYKLLASGKYTGAASHFSATEYTLTADGKFTSRIWATNPPITGRSSGTWGIADGLFLLTEGPITTRFQIAFFGVQPDGRTKLSLVPAGVEINASTMTDDWYRPADSSGTSTSRPVAPATAREVDYVKDDFIWTGANGLDYLPPLSTVSSGAGFPAFVPGIWQNDREQFTLELATDGTYSSAYAGAAASGSFRNREAGRWSADGAKLTLSPTSASISSRSRYDLHAETKNQEISGPRTYQVTTLVLEYSRENQVYRMDGIELKGPTAPWYYTPSGNLSIVLRRTGKPRAN